MKYVWALGSFGIDFCLNEVEELCEDAAQDETVEAVAHVCRQMKRISTWGLPPQKLLPRDLTLTTDGVLRIRANEGLIP